MTQIPIRLCRIYYFEQRFKGDVAGLSLIRTPKTQQESSLGPPLVPVRTAALPRSALPATSRGATSCCMCKSPLEPVTALPARSEPTGAQRVEEGTYSADVSRKGAASNAAFFIS